MFLIIHSDTVKNVYSMCLFKVFINKEKSPFFESPFPNILVPWNIGKRNRFINGDICTAGPDFTWVKNELLNIRKEGKEADESE